MIGNYHFPGDYGCPAPGMPLCRKRSRRNRDAPMWSSFREVRSFVKDLFLFYSCFGVPLPHIFFVNSSFLWRLRAIDFRALPEAGLLKSKTPVWGTGVSSRKSLAQFEHSRRVKGVRKSPGLKPSWIGHGFTGLKAGASTLKTYRCAVFDGDRFRPACGL
jgi:hypothetical protein